MARRFVATDVADRLLVALDDERNRLKLELYPMPL